MYRTLQNSFLKRSTAASSAFERSAEPFACWLEDVRIDVYQHVGNCLLTADSWELDLPGRLAPVASCPPTGRDGQVASQENGPVFLQTTMVCVTDPLFFGMLL